jgi:hypothetical protein
LTRLLVAQDHALELVDLQMVATLSGHIHRNTELQGKYLGEFAQHSVQTNVNILIQPEYLSLRQEMLRVLEAFPEARRAVSKEFQKREAAAVANLPAATPMQILDHRPNND